MLSRISPAANTRGTHQLNEKLPESVGTNWNQVRPGFRRTGMPEVVTNFTGSDVVSDFDH